MQPISSDKWKVIEKLLDEALDLPASERTIFLEHAAQDDPELKTILMQLWEAGHQADLFLEGDVPADVAQFVYQPSTEDDYGPPPFTGMRFGEYEIVEEIGRGGMSVVFRAQRVDGQFDHTVAVKILKRGMDTDQIVRRFKAERQILARLQHANIARLLDGGATADGRPYLIMEYVKGLPITDYCDKEKLDINSRLALFKKAGEAVDFAHRNLIVHRDLKPSNILVTDSGEVKLLDFGIAKVLSTDLDETVLAFTLVGGRIMTPEYAAPEQIFGEPITTATDVYALGVLLYELLCGQLPINYEVRKFPAIERTMRTHKVTLPSASLRSGGVLDRAHIEAIADARSTTTSLLSQKVEGDLDMIVQMALRKEPERRYRSVSELVDEINRYQQGRPVRARPDTFGYRAKKFYGRYRAGVISASVALLLLISSLIGTLWQARVARQQSQIASDERDVARREAAKSARITEFLVDVFEATDPDNALGDTLTAYDILTRGARRIENELGEEPELQGEMMTVVGKMYQRMGDYDAALPWLERALAQRLTLLDSSAVSVLNATYDLGSVMQDQGRYQEAERLLTEALARSGAGDGVERQLAGARTQDLLGAVMVDNGKYEEARAVYLEALNTQIGLLGDEHQDIAPTYVHLGEVLGLISEYEESESYFEKAILIYRMHPEGNADNLAGVLLSYSDVLRNQGKFDAAKSNCMESLEIHERFFGTEHPLVVKSMNQLGNILSEMGENDEAEQIYLEALEVQKNALGEKHPTTIELLGNLGGNYIRMGDLKQAVVHLRRALEMREEVLGKDHPTVAIALSNLGVALGSLGNYEEAEAIHRRCLELVRQHLGGRHPGVANCASNLANVLHKLGRYEEALSYINLAIEIDSETLDSNHRFVAIGISIKGQLLFEMGELEEAQQILEDAIAIFDRSSLPEDHLITVRPKLTLGKLHLSQGRLDLAKPLLEASLHVRRKELAEDDWRLGEAEAAMGMYHLKNGDLQAASALLNAGYKRLMDGLGADNRLTIEAREALMQVGNPDG